MKSVRGVSAAGTGVAVALVMLAVSLPAPAGSDYQDKDFSVRLPAAFLRFTEVSATGGETVANRFSSAINPASVAWTPIPNECGIVLAAYYSNVCFDNGNRLHVVGESLTWDTRTWGTIQPTISQVRSNHHKNRMNIEFDYEVDSVQVQWGKRFGSWAIGWNFNFSKAEVVQSLGNMQVGVSHAESYRFRIGGLLEPVEKWLVGLIFEYGWAPFRSEALGFTPQGPAYFKWNGTQQQFILRPGVSYEYAGMSTVFADYQYGSYFNQRDRLHSHRFSAGVEHRLLQWLFLRATGSFDARGNIGGGCGASLFLSKFCSFDFGYQWDMLPELRPEFGRAHTLQATFNVRF